MRLCVVLSVLINVLPYSILTDKKILNDYIRHYEDLHYDVTDFNNQHLRAKRSADKSIQLKFSALGRKFHLDLYPSDSVFAHDHKSRQSDGKESHVDTSFIYDGKIRGVPEGSVHGAVLGGLFQGVMVVSQDEIYFIEPASRYFRGHNPPTHAHSVIYREDDMNLDPYRHKRDTVGHHGSCGLDKYKEWMTASAQPASNDGIDAYDDVTMDNIYSRDSNTEFNRHKRAPVSCYSKPARTCNLYLRADPVLFNETWNRLGTVAAANNEIMALFSTHVFAINQIYKNTKFETFFPVTTLQTPCFEGINFRILRTTIMTDESLKCNTYLRTSALSFCNPNIDVSNFLNLNSLENHDEFCLAFVFTYRDFSGGTLGLAWVGSPSGAAGGVCERYKTIREQGRTVQKSLNTGIVTLINYARRVPPRVSHLTFAHEVGHNFGSPHDSGSICAPGGDAGNYIMYPSATKGNLRNNELFSECSMDNITRVLNSVVNQINGKVNCFTASDAAFCGNGITEKGEDCDCGYRDDCTDQCCHPRDNLNPNDDKLRCKLKVNGTGHKVQCSPTQGPCCSESCTFKPATNCSVCRPATECSEQEICDGVNATCPGITIKPDMTYCNGYSQVCIKGVCEGSLCKRIGYNSSNVKLYNSTWDECYISHDGSLNDNQKLRLCYLACKNENDTCYVSDDKNIPHEFKIVVDEVKNYSRLDAEREISVAAGTPCDNYRGYCDVFHRCRGVDNDGPLERLKNLIFGEETLSSIKDWIIIHWWGVLLIAVGAVVVMGVFIKVCSVNTPSENPKHKKIRKQNDKKRGPVKNPGPYYITGKNNPREGKDRPRDYGNTRNVEMGNI